MRLRKAISPVIATVIIVAVALAISIAVVGWIMGIWGAVTGGTEMLRILPDSKLYYNGTSVKVVLHIMNEGGATATIFKVEVVGVGSNGSIRTNIEPGKNVYVNVTLKDKNVTVGATYTVKVYTLAGNVYSTQLVAEAAKLK